MSVILFIDLDGTLLDSISQLPEKNAIVLDQAINAGAEVIFSTGRALASTRRLIARFPSIRYLITSNGGCLADIARGQIQCVASFSELQLEHVLQFGAQHGLSSVLYTTDRIFCDAMSAAIYLEVSRSRVLPEIIESLPVKNIVKVLFVAQPENIKNCFEMISQHPTLSDEFDAHISYPEYLEVSPASASKASAAEILLNKLGLNWINAVAFGDSANDIDIMRRSAISVAVANAKPEVKAVASIIAPSNDEAGISFALYWLLFQDSSAKLRLQIRERTAHPVNQNLVSY